MKTKKIYIIVICYCIFNYLLVSNQFYCLPLDLLSKVLENMKDNPSKSGVILQLLYLFLIAYYEYPSQSPEMEEILKNQEQYKEHNQEIKDE